MLDYMRGHTEAGRMLDRALELRFATEAGVGPTWGELAADDFLALQILKQENERWVREDTEARQEQAKQDQRMAQFKQGRGRGV
jgi:hypothetical protein